MEIRKENTKQLEVIWNDTVERQNAKIVFMVAIGQASSISVAQATEILEALDTILLRTTEEAQDNVDHAL
jgi:hypothetical protein